MKTDMIGLRIKNRRKELGLTQTQITKIVGISSGNMSDFETGKKLPSALSLIALSDILECSTDWILTGQEYKSKQNFLTNESENQFINLFHQLPEDEQEEFLGMLQLRLQRIKKKLHTNVASSPLKAPDQSSSAS